MVSWYAGDRPVLCTSSVNVAGTPTRMLTGPPFSSVSSGSMIVIGPLVPGSPGLSVTGLPSVRLYV